MTEYFRPSKIWVGKLCYVAFSLRYRNGTCELPCRITRITDKLRVEVVIIGTDTCHIVDVIDIFDCIDGPTEFYDIPGGKP